MSNIYVSIRIHITCNVNAQFNSIENNYFEHRDHLSKLLVFPMKIESMTLTEVIARLCFV